METDIVLCINANPSMQSFLDFIKENGKQFLERIDHDFGKVRIKIIEFGDYCTDGAEAVLCSPFFHLPSQTDEILKTIAAISYYDKNGNYRGGDIPDNAMETLYYAFNSEFDAKHIRVALFTDAPALRLFERKNIQGYPCDYMSHTITELCEYWNKYRQDKRLSLFVPDDTEDVTLVQPWQEVVTLTKADWIKQPAAFGLDELTIDDIINGLR